MASWKDRVVVASDLVVVGTNPEMADYSNPRGYVYGRRYFAVVSDSRFEYTHFHLFDSADAAERLVDRIRCAAPTWSPVDSDHWHRRTLYGGAAWGDQDEAALERSDVDAEFGPGAYEDGVHLR